jgi:hypothetical protein
MRTERTVPLPKNPLIFDNNSLGLFSMLLSRFELRDGMDFSVMAFHPSSVSVLPLKIRVGDNRRVEVAGKIYFARDVEIRIAGHKLEMLVDESGMVLRDSEQGGTIVIEYQSPRK